MAGQPWKHGPQFYVVLVSWLYPQRTAQCASRFQSLPIYKGQLTCCLLQQVKCLSQFQTTSTHRALKSARGSSELSWALVPHHSYKPPKSVQTLRHIKTWKQRGKTKKSAFHCRKAGLPLALFMFIFNSFKTSKFKLKGSCNKHSPFP